MKGEGVISAAPEMRRKREEGSSPGKERSDAIASGFSIGRKSPRSGIIKVKVGANVDRRDKR